jgi:hypothetical protein
VLETEGRRKGKRCKRLGCVQPRLSSAWHTGLSGGAPDSVRCARLNTGEQAALGRSRRRTTIIHRTVRCAPNCPVSQRSVGPTVGRTIRAGHVAEPTARRVHQTVRCANGSESSTVDCTNFGRKSGTGQCPVVHRTVRCATRQKARIAFLDCSQRLLGPLCL